ncbi:hypothetical protein [Microbacterium paraoxydans]|uniref:hypothetical protein n=1 Tax=Microbacterium paraoxydans TaxID=199592 RepID=UPI003D702A8D
MALEQLSSLREYESVLSGALIYPDWAFAPEFVAAIRAMFEYGFRLLSEVPSTAGEGLSVRDARYREVYDAASEWRVCPFCGVSPLDSPYPLMPRHPLDHYLALSNYPVFGASLSNLVTMCERCNSSFKGAKDVIRRDDGSFRLCVNPHSDFVARVSLLRSVLFAGADGVTPEWRVDLLPEVEEVETWDVVFRVKDRFRLNHLGPRFNDWLEDFAIWARGVSAPTSTQAELSTALAQYADTLPSHRDLGFLREPAFRFLSLKASHPGYEGEALLRVVCAVIAEV